MSEVIGTTEATALDLDPFSFFAGTASRVTGLGGSSPGHDPSYVFHTPYVRAAPGRATFTVRFTGMVAKRGTLVLRVNMLPLEAGAHARLVTSERVQLNRLIAQQNGEISLTFEAFRNVSYAIYGSMSDDGQVSADALTVTLDRPDDGSEYRGALAEARNTIFGTDRIRPSSQLLSTDRATMADPVSQMCTSNQFDEPAYHEWAARLHEPVRRHRKQWEFIYILQALRRYGMIQPGARGLGFGVGREPLPALMAAMGATVVGTDLPPDHVDTAAWFASGQHGSAIESLRRPDLCDDATFAERVSFVPADMTSIPGELVNFDFCWSSCAYEHLGSIKAGLKFVEDSLQSLRPGGLAVHTTEFNLTSNDETMDNAGTVIFRRRDMEQLALALISRGHEVAQIKLDTGDTPLDQHIDMPPYSGDMQLKLVLGRFVTTSFGLIVRKAASLL
jgi:hypothetical protein